LKVSTDVRDVELSPAPPATSMAWRIVAADGSSQGAGGRAWPAEAPGTFSGLLRAPAAPGRYRLIATDGTNEAGADFIVDPAATVPSGGETDALAAWATSRGGRVSSAADVATLIPPADASTAQPQPWHPMRSGWWIAPMTLLVGIEWWTRRRRGLK
jgi:hypothetical protein